MEIIAPSKLFLAYSDWCEGEVIDTKYVPNPDINIPSTKSSKK